jgi:hypothetical protein
MTDPHPAPGRGSGPAVVSRGSERRLDELTVQAQYARQRYDLYRARAYGPRPSNPARLRELERECARAEEALRFAKAELRLDPEPRVGAA